MCNGINGSDSVQGPVAGCCEYGDELSGFYATELVINVSGFVWHEGHEKRVQKSGWET
jgi:hypothetical protein